MKLISVLFLSLVISIFAAAPAAHAQQWFAVQAQVTMTPVQGTASVRNNFAYRMMCSGRVDGLLYSGHYVTSYMNNIVLLPGQYAYVYVYTNYSNPFYRIYPRVSCIFN